MNDCRFLPVLSKSVLFEFKNVFERLLSVHRPEDDGCRQPLVSERQ